MRSPDIRMPRGPSQSGCRRCNICFASPPKGGARKAKAGPRMRARVGAKALSVQRAPPR